VEVNATAGTQQNTGSESTVARAAPAPMGRDQFFQLLVAQMQYQNPLEPMKDTEFIAQMAQFSSLERLEQIGRLQTLGLLGRQVEVVDPETGEPFSDEVAGLDLSGPTVLVHLRETEQALPLDCVIAVQAPDEADQASAATAETAAMAVAATEEAETDGS